MFDHENLVTVGTYTTVGEAEAARLLLEADGLTCFLTDAETVTMNWFMSNAVGGVKLQVPESQADNARRALARSVGQRKKRNLDDYGLGAHVHSTEAGEEDQDEKPEEEEYPGVSEADKHVLFGFRAAVLGIVAAPPLVTIYSLWLLSQVPGMNPPMSPAKKPLAIAALAINGLVIAGVVMVLYTFSQWGLSGR